MSVTNTCRFGPVARSDLAPGCDPVARMRSGAEVIVLPIFEVGAFCAMHRQATSVASIGKADEPDFDV
jgi:hypothetical protein